MSHLINFDALTARMQSRRRTPLHLVLDVHGLLIERAQAGSSRHKAAREFRRPWRTFHRRQAVWLRPYLGTFLSVMFERHTIAIWTSAEERNITPVLDAISREYEMKPGILETVRFAWHRNRCRPDRATGKYASIKSLRDLWEDRHHGQYFTPSNTLLVDDSFTKVRLFPPSAIVVPEYSASQMGHAFENDDTLLWLILYVEYLADRVEWFGTVFDARRECATFEQFCIMGRAQASNSDCGSRRPKTLAHVFLGNLKAVSGLEDVPRDSRPADTEADRPSAREGEDKARFGKVSRFESV